MLGRWMVGFRWIFCCLIFGYWMLDVGCEVGLLGIWVCVGFLFLFIGLLIGVVLVWRWCLVGYGNLVGVGRSGAFYCVVGGGGVGVLSVVQHS
jgi:hypothetical protein